MNPTKVPKKMLGGLFAVLVVGFFAYYLHDLDFDKFRHLRIDWRFILIATVFGLSFRYWSAFIWCTILRDLGSKQLPRFVVMSHIYAKAWMGRYIPGKVAWIAGKIFMAANLGISKSRLSVSSILEAGIQIIAVMAVSLLIVGFDPRFDVIPTQLKAVIVALGCALLVMLNPLIFNRLMRIAYRVIKKEDPSSELRINGKAVIRSFCLYAIGAFFSGTGYFFLTMAVYPQTSFALYFYLVGSYNLAGAIGMAAPFAPSGIGVRDGIQLAMLSVVFPLEVAVVITIISRLWSAAVDIIFFLSATASHRLGMRLQHSQ